LKNCVSVFVDFKMTASYCVGFLLEVVLACCFVRSQNVTWNFNLVKLLENFKGDVCLSLVHSRSLNISVTDTCTANCCRRWITKWPVKSSFSVLHV